MTCTVHKKISIYQKGNKSLQILSIIELLNQFYKLLKKKDTTNRNDQIQSTEWKIGMCQYEQMKGKKP